MLIKINTVASYKGHSVKANGTIDITFRQRTVNMKSIMGVMSLAIPSQSEITISCEGEDEELALNAIVEILEKQKVIETIID